MKLKDIVNSQCDIRKYLSIDIPDEVKDELENWDYDVDSVLQAARIYVDADKFDEEIIPLKLNDNQKVVLEWLKQTAPTGKPMQVVFWMMNNAAWGHLDELRDPLMELTDKQQFEVLAAFAQWGLGQEETE